MSDPNADIAIRSPSIRIRPSMNAFIESNRPENMSGASWGVVMTVDVASPSPASSSHRPSMMTNR